MTRRSPPTEALPARSCADEHATRLLASLGISQRVTAGADHPALAWRRAGLLSLTGLATGPGLTSPIALTEAADGALAALRAIAPGADLPQSGAALLGERARLLGLTRRGATSPNGSCHLLVARDGTFALNLARPDDWSLLPALFEDEVATQADVARLSATRDLATLVERGRLLGLAIAASPETVPAAVASPIAIDQIAPPSPRSRSPLVVDFSGLWAGPLAGALLQRCGAEVIKVESLGRPDGARFGDPAMFALLNAGKRSVAFDFSNPHDTAALRTLVRRADIVIEASRPRALLDLGLDAVVEAARGAVWLSITAHGRSGPAAHWIGFGDDAGVAGGLSAAMFDGWGTALFAGDAIADPLTGITAALAAWASWRSGGGRIVALALSQVVEHAVGLSPAGSALPQWHALAQADTAPLYPVRRATAAARLLGADTADVLAGL